MAFRGFKMQGSVESNGGPIFLGDTKIQAESIHFGSRHDPGKFEAKFEPTGQFQCLRDLYSIDSVDPLAEKLRLEQAADELIESAYHWIFEDRAFQQWLDGGEHRILRITGDPGKGKSIMMIGIIDYLAELLPKSKRCAMTFFFCRATDDRLSTADAVLRGLLHRLLDQKSNEILVKYLQTRHETRGSKIFEGSSARFILQEVLVDILNDQSFDEYYLFVDGLDECSENLKDLLALIKFTTEKAPKLRWMVSSRNYEKIDRFFRTVDHHRAIVLEASQNQVDRGIATYIGKKADFLTERYELAPEQGDKIVKVLSEKAQGTYLYVHLVCKALVESDRWTRAEKILNDIPPGLDAMFGRMAENLVQATSDSEDRRLCCLLLSTVTFALRPLRPSELVAIVNSGTRESEQSLKELVRIITKCGSFLTLEADTSLVSQTVTKSEDTIYFVHQSAKDFLEAQVKLGESIISGSIDSNHQLIAKSCLALLINRLQQNICNLESPEAPPPGLDDIKVSAMIDLEYASCNWASHLKALSIHPFQELTDLVQDFMKERLLYWIEVLTILGKVNYGVTQIQYLLDIYQV
ncbi:hypothetical protein H072_11100 [Dactylellina haptotyla CBS 200.50]|uniref:NACHT domain-containing protein n=1 Tax=Dactylellina haptotyla (strain CBS 200.50) TaxID=1284197 RepID=S8A2Z5_DACHA|nr:hypothetical protein H072_11100 [Dactylellina haptotyla CBS 200.50]